ncbi:hypothetical protein M0R72_09220 [Candidatus Pacearchaeota archaeon]|jgi:hypothetical protein|nr:hypothetical protein [Candidatus Pacearchaeota archaeon]
MNHILFWIAVWCLRHVNSAKANLDAEWDDAMDMMEHQCHNNGIRLCELANTLHILSSRASERAEDLALEEPLPPQLT